MALTLIAPRFLAAISWVVQVQAITLWPFIISREPMAPAMLNHERIHLRQQVELLVLGFYLVYLYDWLRGRFLGLDAAEAYYNIRFEREAYANEYSYGYLETRPFWAWRDYGN